MVHLGALGNGFAYDDMVVIAGDAGLRSFDGLLTRLLEPSWPAAFADEIGAWRPLSTLLWALVWIASGGSPVAYHAVGVLLHGVVTGLGVRLFALVTPAPIALAAGLLFAVHPVHVEAVANVVGSSEALAAAFALGALLVHARGRREGYGPRRIAAVTGLYVLAVFAKEGAAVLPGLLVLLDAARRDVPLPSLPRYVRERGALLATLTVALAAVLLARHGVVGAVAAASHPPGAEVLRDAPRVWTVFSTWPEYVRLLFAPATLAADYGPAVVPVAFGWTARAVAGAIVGIAAFAMALFAWRRGEPLSVERPSPRLLGFAVLWVAFAVLPVANVVYLGPVLVAERTLYLASWGACLMLAWLIHAIGERTRRRTAVIVATMLVVAGAVRSATRVPAWNDTETIMAALIRDHPESGTAWMHLGRTLARQGRGADALTAFGHAVVLLDSEYRPATEIGAHLLAMGRPASAAFFLERAWREHPEWPTAPGLLAAARLAEGRPERAAEAARAAIAIQPENASMHHLLAQALAASGAWAEAARARERSLQTGFGDRGRSWILLARERAEAGDTVGAHAALDSADLRPLDETARAAAVELRAELGPGR